MPASVAARPTDGPLNRDHKIMALTIGLVFGFLLGLTSVGSGVFFGMAMVTLFPLSTRKVVGTDIFHGAMVTLAAAFGTILWGTPDFSVVGRQAAVMAVGADHIAIAGGRIRCERRLTAIAGMTFAVGDQSQTPFKTLIGTTTGHGWALTPARPGSISALTATPSGAVWAVGHQSETASPTVLTHPSGRRLSAGVSTRF